MRIPLLIVFILSGCSSEPSQSAKPDKPTEQKKRPQPKTVEMPLEKTNQAAGEQFWKNATARTPSSKSEETPPPIRRVGPHQFMVGQFLVDQKEKWVKIKSRVNQNEDILEYFSCGPRGKLHECVLLSFGLPSHLHLALLLIGAEPGAEYGSELTITAEWKNMETGAIVRHPAAEFLWDRLQLRKGQNIVWNFVGSRFMSGHYQANVEQSLIAVINDSLAVIGIKDIVGNAHKGPNQGFEANLKTTPEKGTPVDIYVQLVD